MSYCKHEVLNFVVVVFSTESIIILFLFFIMCGVRRCSSKADTLPRIRFGGKARPGERERGQPEGQ